MKREDSRVIKYTPFWAFGRIRVLEMHCNPNLRTHVRLGKKDLTLLVKDKDAKNGQK